MTPERQLGLDAVLGRRQSQLCQPPRLGARPELIGHLGIRRTPPQRQRLGEHLRRPSGLARGERLAALRRERLKTPCVGLLGVQHIARGAGGEHVAAPASRNALRSRER